MKETSTRIAKLAARILDGGKYTRKDVLALAGSALVQAEKDEGAVKAWAIDDGERIYANTQWGKSQAKTFCLGDNDQAIHVSIRRIQHKGK